MCARKHDACTRLLRVPLLPILRAHACLAALTALRLPRMRRAQARPRPAAQRRCVHASVVLCAALPELSVLRAVARHCGVPVLQCMRDVQEAARRAGSAAGHRCRICTGTGFTPATSAPGRGSPLPRLHRDGVHPCHICTGTGITPATSAPGPGSPLPRLHRDRALPCHVCTEIDRSILESAHAMVRAPSANTAHARRVTRTPPSSPPPPAYILHAAPKPRSEL
jgi:hypothetical protein